MLIHNLLRHKGRTIMSIVAVVISSALLVSLLSVAEGIWQNASYSILTSREDIAIIPQVSPGSGDLWGISNGHKIADDIKKDTENITEVSPMYTGLLKVEILENSSNSPSNSNEFQNSNDELTDTGTKVIPLTPIVISIGIIPERFEKFLVNNNTYNFGIIELKFNNNIPSFSHIIVLEGTSQAPP